jgi:hypothetical protein
MIWRSQNHHRHKTGAYCISLSLIIIGYLLNAPVRRKGYPRPSMLQTTLTVVLLSRPEVPKALGEMDLWRG